MATARTIRYSRQRELIYDYLRGTREHPTADTIYESLRERSESLSMGTVYRNLRLLEELGRVRVVATVNGAERFEACVDGVHAHFVCDGCGRVIDLPAADPATSQMATDEPEVGSVSHVDLIFHGLCTTCLSK